MKYTTTVLALAVAAATSVEGKRTIRKPQFRRELELDIDMSMSMITSNRGGSSKSKTTGSSSDETVSCAELLTGSWSATEEDICKLFTITDGTIKKDCSRNQAFTFDVDPETNTLEMTSNFVRLSNGELQEVTLIGFINDKDGTCSFRAASVSSSNTIEGSVGEDGVLHVEVTKPGGVENDSAGAFQGLFTKVPDGFPFISFPIMSPFVCFAEGEECRTDAPDTVNGGCNSPNQDKFGSIVLGETKCGSASTYVVKKGRKKTEFRDTDWYKYDHAGGTVSVILRASFGRGEIILEKFPDSCEDREIVKIVIDERDQTFFKATAIDLPPGQYVWIVTEDRFGTGDECGGETGNDYTFTIVEEEEDSEPMDGIEAVSESGTTMNYVSFDDANPGSFKADEMDGAEGSTTYDDE